MHRLLSAVSVLALLASFTPDANAAPPLEPERAQIGAQIAAGGATLTAPDDASGEPTLLYGTAFTGPAFRFAATFDYDLVGPLSLGAELALGRSKMRGYAEVEESRRDLSFRLTSCEGLLRLRGQSRSGPVRPYGLVGLGFRASISASAVDEREGFDTDEGAPAIATRTGGLFAMEAGVILRVGPVDVPVGVRAARSLGYAGNTRGRLDGYQSLADPGSFRVDASWSYGVTVGVAYRF